MQEYPTMTVKEGAFTMAQESGVRSQAKSSGCLLS